MKTIYKGRSDLYYVFDIEDVQSDEWVPVSPSELDAFTIELFTTGTPVVVKTNEDISMEGVLHVSAADLSVLPDGPIRMRINVRISDENWDDGAYDQTELRQTGYFLKSINNS